MYFLHSITEIPIDNTIKIGDIKRSTFLNDLSNSVIGRECNGSEN